MSDIRIPKLTLEWNCQWNSQWRKETVNKKLGTSAETGEWETESVGRYEPNIYI